MLALIAFIILSCTAWERIMSYLYSDPCFEVGIRQISQFSDFWAMLSYTATASDVWALLNPTYKNISSWTPASDGTSWWIMAPSQNSIKNPCWSAVYEIKENSYIMFVGRKVCSR